MSERIFLRQLLGKSHSLIVALHGKEQTAFVALSGGSHRLVIVIASVEHVVYGEQEAVVLALVDEGSHRVSLREVSGVRVIAEHKDINDEDQTVKIPHIRTTASDRDGNKEILADGSVVIQDTVSYDGLPVANADDTYTMTGTLMDKETGESVKDASGNPITASTSFHNTTESGTVILEFRVSDAAAVLEGKTVVVFEVITDKDGKEIAKHEDIEDKDQTIHFPGVKTTAADDAGSKELKASGKMTVVDEVEVTNVTPGNEYTIKGTLIDKATGETAVDAAGKPITSSVTFVPTTANGSIKLTFTFDGSNFEGKTLVAFGQPAGRQP